MNSRQLAPKASALPDCATPRLEPTIGIEPTTCGLQNRCTTNCATLAKFLYLIYSIIKTKISISNIYWCAQRDSNPHGLRPADFKSAAAAITPCAQNDSDGVSQNSTYCPAQFRNLIF